MKNPNFKKSINTLLALTSLTSLAIATQIDTPPPASIPQDNTTNTSIIDEPLSADSKIHFGSLDNGFSYALIPNSEPPAHVSLKLLVRAGSLMETDQQRGLAHFLEHMAFNGSKNFPKNSLIEYFQRIGMQFGAHTNAYTTFDHTTYMLELPNNKDNYINDALTVMRDYCDGLLLEPDSLNQERGIILSEKRDSLSADEHIRDAMFETIFPKTLVPLRLPIGIEEVIENAPREQFTSFYNTWYTPDRTTLIIAGDINIEKTKKMIEEKFNSLSKPLSPKNPTLTPVLNSELSASSHFEKEATSNEFLITLTQNLPKEKFAQTTQNRIDEVQLELLNQLISTRIDQLRRQPNSPITDGSYSNIDFLNTYRIHILAVEFPENKANKAIAAAEQEMRKALQFGFTDSELQIAKAKVLRKYQTALDQSHTQKSQTISYDTMRKLAQNKTPTSQSLDLDLAKQALDLSNPQNIHQLLKDNWYTSGNKPILYLSGKPSINLDNNQIIAQFNQSSSTKLSPLENIAIKEFAYTHFGPTGKIKEELNNNAKNLSQLVFENNVRLNLLPTNFESGKVYVKVRVGGGDLEADPNLPGLPELTEKMLFNGGLQKHTTAELQNIFAANQVDIDFSIDRDAFSFKATTNEDDLLPQLQLISAYLTDPALRPEAHRIALEELNNEYKEYTHTPMGIYQSKVDSFLANNDHRFGKPNFSDIQKRTPNEIKNWIQKPFNSGYTEITIVGDFSPEIAQLAVAQTLGALPQRNPSKDNLKTNLNISFPSPQKDPKLFEVDTQFERAISAVFWPTDDTFDIVQARKLSLLGAILSDRLRAQIREELGDAYSTQALNSPNKVFKNYGRFLAVAFTAPKTALKVNNSIKQISQDLLKNGIQDDEFTRAVQPTLSSILQEQRTNSYWIDNLHDSQEYPQKVDWALEQHATYQGFTKKDIESVAQQFLTQEKSVPILIVPKNTQFENS